MKSKCLRLLLTTVTVLMLLLSLMGCGSKKDSTSSEMYDSAPSIGVGESEQPQTSTSDTNADAMKNSAVANRKIIENRYISMETLEFDLITVKAENLVYQYLGYVEGADITGNSLNGPDHYNTRYATYTFRIPTVSYNQFVKELKEMGNVVTERVVKEDVTMQYFDMKARTDTLKVQEARLLELIENAQVLTQIIEVEDKLTDVRYQIETYTATLNNLENLVDFGTVQLELREVFEETIIEQPAVTVGEKISKGFSRSILNVKNIFITLFIWLITASPYLVVWGVFIIGVVFLVKRIDARVKRKEAKKDHQKQDKID